MLGFYARVGNPGMAPVESAHLGWIINFLNNALLPGDQGACASSARRKSSTGSSPSSHIEPAMSEPPLIPPDAYSVYPDRQCGVLKSDGNRCSVRLNCLLHKDAEKNAIPRSGPPNRRSVGSLAVRLRMERASLTAALFGANKVRNHTEPSVTVVYCCCRRCNT